jgi:lycopene beta-cyclase
MKRHEYDYIIAGAGLAGLALATSLIDNNARKKIALIDSRLEYKRDHIWSCWNNVNGAPPLPFDYSWNKWQVRSKSKTSTCNTERYPYISVLAESYYKRAVEKIEKSEGIDLFLDESIRGEDFESDGVTVDTSKRRLTASLLFDSRPPRIDSQQLQQDFFGIIVKSVEKKFDPNCVTLMDFSELQSKKRGFHFFYILPFTEYEALVESVFIGFERLSQEEHRLQIIRHLEQKFELRIFDETHVEHGLIAMHRTTESPAHKRHYLIGARAGLIRPSTGYGFASIHRFSNELAKLLKNEDFPEVPLTYTRKSKLLDAVLLLFLKERISEGPMIFSSLFKSVEPDALVRFLCDASSPMDDSKVLAAMPGKIKLGSIMASLLRTDDFR